MDTLMTKSFEDRFFDELSKKFDSYNGRMDRQDEKLEKILAQAQKTNGRVNKLEDRTTTLEKSTGRKFNIPPNILYLLAAGGLITLIIVANLLGINLKGVL